MALNIALKMAFLEAGKKQSDIAQRLAISDSRLSRIIHGYLPPTADEKRALAKELRKPVSQLFPEALAS